MPSRSFQDNQPTTPSINHHSVVVEAQDNTTTSPLTSSLGGSPARTNGERTPDYPLARAGVMSHYPPHHQNQQQPQHQAAAAAGRDPRYLQMISTGPHPHFQGHVTYLPPNIPQLYGTAGGGGSQYAAAPGGYPPPPPPPQQHPGGSPGQHQHQHHQTYVITGYPPIHGHQQGPPSSGSHYLTMNMPPGSYPPPPQGGAYHPHHGHPGHPPSPHHPHHPRPPHGHSGSAAAPPPGAPMYVRHGPPGGGGGYPPSVMYSQQGMPPRGPMAPVSASTTHTSTMSKSSAHLSEKEPSHSMGETIKGHHESSMQSMEEMQAEREKEEMAMEQVLKSVKPIQTDYHLFIEEEKNKLVELATKDGGDDLYLRNSNLNYRLKAAWEALEPSQRAIYLKREELDRKRFMEEEEIASRHCATLTARNSTPSSRKKSQSTAEVTVDDDEDVDEEEARDEAAKRAREKDEIEQNESPLKKERVEQDANNVKVEQV